MGENNNTDTVENNKAENETHCEIESEDHNETNPERTNEKDIEDINETEIDKGNETDNEEHNETKNREHNETETAEKNGTESKENSETEAEENNEREAEEYNENYEANKRNKAESIDSMVIFKKVKVMCKKLKVELIGEEHSSKAIKKKSLDVNDDVKVVKAANLGLEEEESEGHEGVNQRFEKEESVDGSDSEEEDET